MNNEDEEIEEIPVVDNDFEFIDYNTELALYIEEDED
jgi:hypothetical protein